MNCLPFCLPECVQYLCTVCVQFAIPSLPWCGASGPGVSISVRKVLYLQITWHMLPHQTVWAALTLRHHLSMPPKDDFIIHLAHQDLNQWRKIDKRTSLMRKICFSRDLIKYISTASQRLFTFIVAFYYGRERPSRISYHPLHESESPRSPLNLPFCHHLSA